MLLATAVGGPLPRTPVTTAFVAGPMFLATAAAGAAGAALRLLLLLLLLLRLLPHLGYRVELLKRSIN